MNVSPAPVFDLALNKSLAPGQSASVFPGALVKYRLTVSNQGNVAATQIALSDSLPTGMTLAGRGLDGGGQHRHAEHADRGPTGSRRDGLRRHHGTG